VKTQQMTKCILGGVIAVGLTFFCASTGVDVPPLNTSPFQRHNLRIARGPRGSWLPTLDAFRALAA
jgi:hypothetical protein